MVVCIAWGRANDLGALADDIEGAGILEVKVVVKVDGGDCR